jgi:hypothetical protein
MKSAACHAGHTRHSCPLKFRQGPRESVVVCKSEDVRGCSHSLALHCLFMFNKRGRRALVHGVVLGLCRNLGRGVSDVRVSRARSTRPSETSYRCNAELGEKHRVFTKRFFAPAKTDRVSLMSVRADVTERPHLLTLYRTTSLAHTLQHDLTCSHVTERPHLLTRLSGQIKETIMCAQSK